MSKMKITFALAAALILASACVLRAGPYPDPERLFSWSPQEQLLGYKSVEKILPAHTAPAAENVLPLPPDPDAAKIAAALEKATDRFMAQGNVVGVLVLRRGKILVERYQLDFTADDRWTSFSVAKSVTSTLCGAAIKDGHIKSVNDDVTKYVPELKGTAYDGVTLKHILTMTSGVHWDENYYDAASDTAQIVADVSSGGKSMLEALAKLKREAKPGKVFAYKTGESNLLGLAIQRATGKSLAEYLGEKIWEPFGMERPAAWASDSSDMDLGGCCLSAGLRDYGRFGLFILGGGRADGQEVLPAGWLAEATRDQTGFGYGYQWRTLKNGSFMASGIFGQTIYISPKDELVMVSLAAWPTPTSREFNQARVDYALAVHKIIAALK